MKQLLFIENLSKKYHQQILLNQASLIVHENQKIGFIGRNGTGKSTLFKIILGIEPSDEGTVKILDHTRIGYLRQEDDFMPNATIMQHLENASGKEPWQCAKIAARFNLTPNDLNKKITDFSGGYRMRIKLTAMLLQDPNLLLLDEPTNYLDLSTMILLEKFLANHSGACVIISHDRFFLENVCKETIELEHGVIKHYPEKLSEYLKYKETAGQTLENFNKKQEAKEKHLQKFITRFGAKASKASQAQSKIKQIEKITYANIQTELPTIRIKPPKTSETKGSAIRLYDVSIGYKNIIIAKNINFEINKGEHLAILGDNGQGKSTFFKTLTGNIVSLGGEIKINSNLRIGYYAQHKTTELDPHQSVENHLASTKKSYEEIRKMAGSFLFLEDDMIKSINVLSGGEKARLCLATILLDDYDILFLDEPTNHLDFQTAEALATALKKSNLTILFISHDRTFSSILTNHCIEVKNGTIRRITQTYTDYIQNISQTETFSEKSNDDRLTEAQKQYKKVIFQERKELLQKIQQLEKEISKLKKEKEVLFDYFVKNPTKPTPQKIKELAKIEDEIIKSEEELITVNEKLSKS